MHGNEKRQGILRRRVQVGKRGCCERKRWCEVESCTSGINTVNIASEFNCKWDSPRAKNKLRNVP